MNDAHWHLAVNHLPVIFPLVGLIVLVVGLIAKSEAVKRTAYLIFVLAAFGAIAAMNTGERAEDMMETILPEAENYIEEHEETAETFAILAYILGGLALLGLWASFKAKRFSGAAGALVLVFAVVALVFAKETSTSGGEIRHTEIRPGADSSAVPPQPEAENEHEH